MARGWMLGLCVAATAVVAVVLSGCPRPAATVRVDGSSTVFLITEAAAEEFRKVEPGVRVAAGFSGTGGGFKRFCAGELDICGASRPISESERAACEKNGIEFIELEVAFDGTAIVANLRNDWCDCLTTEQLRAIWEPGSPIKRWSDIDPSWPEERIRLYGPDTDSGTFDYFTEVIVGEVAASRDDFTQSADDNVLVRGVEGDAYSLGYFGLAYYQENRHRLKLLGVDAGDGCVLPTAETVRDDTYRPLSRPLYLYVRQASLQRPEVRAFVEFYMEQAEQLAPAVGYVPVTDEMAARNREVLRQALSQLEPAA